MESMIKRFLIPLLIVLDVSLILLIVRSMSFRFLHRCCLPAGRKGLAEADLTAITSPPPFSATEPA